MIVTLKRRARFAAAHNYNLPGLSRAQNLDLFGSYAALEGHGHNYRVEVAVAGHIDERTGMVINITEIDRLLKTRIVKPLDGKFLNREVEYFRERAPSTENLALYALSALIDEIPSPAILTGIAVWESDTLWSHWRRSSQARETVSGNGANMLELTRAYEFSASHRLHSNQLSQEENTAIFGKCDNPNGHGHNYEIEITMAGVPDQRTGMLFSLDELDRVVQAEVLDVMDHKHLNLDVPDFAEINPTSEMLAIVIWNRLAKCLPTQGDPRLAKVLVRETARNVFEYCGE